MNTRGGLPPRSALAVVLLVAMAIMIPLLLNREVIAEPTLTPIRDGTELVFVLMVSSTCSGISAPGFDEALTVVRSYLEEEAKDTGRTLVKIGIATDWILEDGIAVLNRFGPFDEIMVGRGWMNSGAVEYLWDDFPGRASVPQIVVLERDVTTGKFIQVLGTKVLYRKSSAGQIIEWARSLESRRSESEFGAVG